MGRSAPQSRSPSVLADAFDDTQVALGRLAEHLERALIRLAIMGGDGALHAVELDEDDSLRDTGLIGFGGIAAREEAPAGGGNGGARELGVGGKRIRIGDRAVNCNPISFCHRVILPCWTGRVLRTPKKSLEQSGSTRPGHPRRAAIPHLHGSFGAALAGMRE